MPSVFVAGQSANSAMAFLGIDAFFSYLRAALIFIHLVFIITINVKYYGRDFLVVDNLAIV